MCAKCSHSVRFDKYDTLWVVDKGTNAVVKFNPAGYVMMHGPMLRLVLEDRFKMKTHRDPREIPIFELVLTAQEIPGARY